MDIGWVFTAEWPKDNDVDDLVEAAVDTMASTVQSLAQERGLLLDTFCMSFASSRQKVLRSYGTDNIRRMQDAAAKYDPDGVFQKLQNNGFLLRDNV